jgi:hypothetical protein
MSADTGSDRSQPLNRVPASSSDGGAGTTGPGAGRPIDDGGFPPPRKRKKLSLRFHPATWQDLEVLLARTDGNFGRFANDVCRRYADGNLVLDGDPPSSPSRGNTGNKGTSIDLDLDLEARLEALAAAKDLTLSMLIRRILEWFVDGVLIPADAS